jgi:hypothetical protein
VDQQIKGGGGSNKKSEQIDYQIEEGVEVETKNISINLRKRGQTNNTTIDNKNYYNDDVNLKSKSNFRRIILLIIAVTVHNIPGNF